MADALATVRLVHAELRRERVPFDDAWETAFPDLRPHGADASVRLALVETKAVMAPGT